MAIPLQSAVEIAVQGVAAGQAVVNVFHYIPSTLGIGFTATMAQCLTAFRTMWRASVLPALSDAYTVLNYKGRNIVGTRVDPNNPNKFIFNIGDVADLAGAGAADNGGDAGDPLPTYAAMTLRKVTGVGGKRKKGSVRLGPLTEASTEALDQNKLTAASIALGNAACTGLKGTLGTAVAGDSLVPVVFSRTTEFAPPQPVIGVALAVTAISDMFVNLYVGSQVSRKQRANLGA